MSIPNGYIRTSRTNRCPICGRPDGCLIHREGKWAGCIRVMEGCDRIDGSPVMVARDLPTYRHTIDAARVRRPLLTPPRKGHNGQRMDWEQAARTMEAALGDAGMMQAEKTLGISADSLWRLRIGWCEKAAAHSFPMYGETGQMIGIRLRTGLGKKFCVGGSKNGLFIPCEMTGDGPLLIVEGPTDCGAALDWGFDAIGRPSALACVAMTVAYCRRQRREVVIVANHDEPKYRLDINGNPMGEPFYPGQEGGEKLANELASVGLGVKLIEPLGAKDCRQWKREGATREVVETVIDNARWWSAKR